MQLASFRGDRGGVSPDIEASATKGNALHGHHCVLKSLFPPLVAFCPEGPVLVEETWNSDRCSDLDSLAFISRKEDIFRGMSIVCSSCSPSLK